MLKNITLKNQIYTFIANHQKEINNKEYKLPLEDVILIDNNPISYLVNIDNGLPISTWYDNSSDNELMKLVPDALSELINAKEVIVEQKIELMEALTDGTPVEAITSDMFKKMFEKYDISNIENIRDFLLAEK